MSRITLDRRAFLGSAGFAAGAVVVTTMVPLSVVHALPGGIALSVAEPTGFGSVDDACGHWPPYAHPIPYSHAPMAASVLAHADPLDHIFLI